MPAVFFSNVQPLGVITLDAAPPSTATAATKTSLTCTPLGIFTDKLPAALAPVLLELDDRNVTAKPNSYLKMINPVSAELGALDEGWPARASTGARVEAD